MSVLVDTNVLKNADIRMQQRCSAASFPDDLVGIIASISIVRTSRQRAVAAQDLRPIKAEWR